MTKNMFIKKKKTASVVVILLTAVAVILLWGRYIPILNTLPLPFIAGDHSGHLAKPVFDEEGGIEYWTCAMHPSVRMIDAGGCPICGMDMLPVRDEPAPQETPAQGSDMESGMEAPAGGGMQGHQHGGAPMGVPAPAGKPKSTFYVSPERQQMINVKKERVERRDLERTLRTVGVVELDETTISHISTKIGGWIEDVNVDFTWQKVTRGEPLFSIYSPELVSTQAELLLALEYQSKLSGSGFPEVSGGSASLLESTRRRLRLFDISEAQIRQIEQTGRVRKNLVIDSPVTGYVTYKNAFEGMRVDPDTRVYTLADLSTVWLYADIYENEVSLVSIGQRARLTMSSLPGEAFEGLVTHIWPNVDPKTRTVRVRMELANPGVRLFPGMYADVEMSIPLGELLTVPESAVLRTGKEDLVLVDRGEGALELRRVEIGRGAAGFYEVLRGLRQGEVVVSNSRFLIDAESKLRAVKASWGDEMEEGMQDD